MAKKYVRLVNKSEQTLPIPWGKSTIRFSPRGQPGSVQDLPEDAAEYCRGHYGDMLQVIEPTASVSSLIPNRAVEKFYVANMTGDPDAPEYVGEFFNLRTQKQQKEMNDNKQPQEFTCRLGRFNGLKQPGEWRYQGEGGRWQYNDKPVQVTTPGKVIKIPPYGRIEVTQEQQESILSTQREAPDGLRGRVIASRAPSGFEPDFDDPSWTLNRMRTWLGLIPGSGTKPMGRDIVGPAEEELRASFEDEDEADVALAKARFDMWTRCQLRAMDPQFRLPTEKDFNAALGREARAAKRSPKEQTSTV